MTPSYKGLVNTNPLDLLLLVLSEDLANRSRDGVPHVTAWGVIHCKGSYSTSMPSRRHLAFVVSIFKDHANDDDKGQQKHDTCKVCWVNKSLPFYSKRERYVGANNSDPIVLCRFYCFHQPTKKGWPYHAG